MAWYCTNLKYLPSEYLNLSYLDKTILHHSRYEHYEEEIEKNKMLGGEYNG